MDQRVTHTAEIAGRTVLVRASLDDGACLADLGALLRKLADAGARVVVLTAFGRPTGEFDPTLSLERFAEPLSKVSGKPVRFVSQSVGASAEAGVAAVAYGELALVENLAFHRGEAGGDRTFAMRLSVLGDLFLDATDGHGEREAASLTMLPEFLPRLPRIASTIPSTRET